MKDAEFLAAAEKAQLAVDSPMSGQELAQMVAKVSATPTDVVKMIEETFALWKAGKL